MKETLRPGSSEVTPGTLPAPKGIGMAVAFDWGLTAELLVLPFLPLFLGDSASLKRFNLSPVSSVLVSIGILWPIAIAFAVFGEGVRSGWRWTRSVQVIGNTLGFLGGFALLVNVWQGAKNGNYWSVVPAFILLVFSPIIAWRMSRPPTKQWFKTVKRAEARKRHGGFWVLGIMVWSIVGGVLVAISAYPGR